MVLHNDFRCIQEVQYHLSYRPTLNFPYQERHNTRQAAETYHQLCLTKHIRCNKETYPQFLLLEAMH